MDLAGVAESLGQRHFHLSVKQMAVLWSSHDTTQPAHICTPTQSAPDYGPNHMGKLPTFFSKNKVILFYFMFTLWCVVL